MWASFEYWLVYCFPQELFPHFSFFLNFNFSTSKVFFFFFQDWFRAFPCFNTFIFVHLIEELRIFFASKDGWRRMGKKVYHEFFIYLHVFLWFFIIIQIVSASQRISMGSSKNITQSMLYLSFFLLFLSFLCLRKFFT